jgi:hypothetical protein
MNLGPVEAEFLKKVCTLKSTSIFLASMLSLRNRPRDTETPGQVVFVGLML